MEKNRGEQPAMKDYQLKEVQVRLYLKEGETLYSEQPLKSPHDAMLVMREALREMDREMVCVVNLDTRLRPINYNVVSVGSLNASVSPVQNVFKSSILSNAASIMLLHNHPSGDATPSKEDYNLTIRLSEAGKLLNIPLMDHVVIGAMQGDVYSFHREHPELFDEGSLDWDLIHGMQEEDRVREPDVRKDWRKTAMRNEVPGHLQMELPVPYQRKEALKKRPPKVSVLNKLAANKQIAGQEQKPSLRKEISRNMER